MSDPEDGSSQLIQACPGCGNFLDVSEQEPFAQVHCPSCGTLLRVRTQFRNYTLQAVMGVGGMGTVFKALDLNLQRHVALKVLRKEYSANDADIGKLEREARITAMVNHPNVVKIFSFGSDHGQFFLAMELVEKGSLDDLLELQGQVAELQVLEIGIQIASGLRAAHQIGLIHRDVKPGNILFSDAHATKIVDFGLAIVMEEEAAQRGEIWGTPYYVAPEKLDNRPEDFRSDIYSLGATMFHSLAGRPPYEAQTASLVALKHLKSQPISLQAFAPDVSSETAYVVNKTMHKEPEERYQSYDELIEHLNYAKERVSEALANRSRPRQRVVVESEEAQSHIGGVILAIAALLLLGGIGVWFFRDSIFPNKRETAPSASTSKQEAEVAVGISLSKIEDRYSAARQMLASGDFASAQSEFDELLKTRGLKEPALTWVRIQYALACYLAGDTATGDEFLTDLNEKLSAPDVSEKIKDTDLLNAVLELAKHCSSDDVTPKEYASLLNPAGPEALTALVYGARNWRKAAYEDAGPFFQIFRSARVPASMSWTKDYKELIDMYAADYRLYRDVQRAAQNAKTPAAKIAASKLAEESAAKIQTTGGLSDFLREYAKRLSDDAKKAETEAEAAAAAVAALLDGKASAELDRIRTDYVTAVQKMEMDKAAALLAPIRQNAELAASTKIKNHVRILEWLLRFKAGLIADLSAGTYSGSVIKNRAGAVMGDSIRAADAAGIEITTKYGATKVAWSELSPTVLVQIAEKLASTRSGQAANDALWLAGVYAYECGLKDNGRELLLRASRNADSLKDGLSVFFEVAQTDASK